MNAIIQDIRNRLYKKNKNWIAAVVGSTGSGKSYSAIRLASAINPNFSVDFVVFSAEEFMALLNSGKPKKGDVIVFDEAGVAVNPREWYTDTNRAINYVMQTFRRDNLAVIFTTPDFEYIDKQIRKLLHAYIETQRINRKEQYVAVKLMNIQYNPRYGKLYYKYPRIMVNGRIKTLKSVRIKKPDKVLLKEYEKRKKVFCRQLNVQAEQRIEDRKNKKAREPTDVTKMVEDVISNYEEYMKEYNGRRTINTDLIKLKYPIGEPTAKKIKIGAEKELKKRGEF